MGRYRIPCGYEHESLPVEFQSMAKTKLNFPYLITDKCDGLTDTASFMIVKIKIQIFCMKYLKKIVLRVLEIQYNSSAIS